MIPGDIFNDVEKTGVFFYEPNEQDTVKLVQEREQLRLEAEKWKKFVLVSFVCLKVQLRTVALLSDHCFAPALPAGSR